MHFGARSLFGNLPFSTKNTHFGAHSCIGAQSCISIENWQDKKAEKTRQDRTRKKKKTREQTRQESTERRKQGKRPMIPTQGEAHKLNNWKLLQNEVSDKKGLWYSRERAPGSKCNVDRRRGRYATNFSLWLLHYRLTILESFESLRQHTWSLHTFENKSLSKWNNVYNWNISIDIHIFRHRTTHGRGIARSLIQSVFKYQLNVTQ